MSDLKAEGAEAVAAEIKAAGGEAVGLACDVTSEEACAAVVAAAVERFGKLTILVQQRRRRRTEAFRHADGRFRVGLRLNVYSTFRLTQLAAPHMEKAGGGAVLNISSMAGENKNQRMASYGSSKAAVNHLTRNIAFDLGPRNIRVNAIAPGAIKTKALRASSRRRSRRPC